MEDIQLVDYAQEFVHVARDHAHEFPAIKKSSFTSRQSIAIASLGTARILRQKKPLQAEDLIKISIITSPPENQKYSEYIALKILYGDETKNIHKPVTKLVNTIQNTDFTGSQLLLNDILNFLNIEKSVDITFDLEIINFADELEDDLFKKEHKRIISDDELLRRARERVAFEIVGGRGGIIKHNINSKKSMFKVAKYILLQRIASFNSEDLIASQILGHSDEISKITLENFIEIMSNLMVTTRLNDIKELDSDFSDIINSFTQYQLTMGYTIMIEYKIALSRYSISQKFYAPLLQHIINEFEKNIINKAEIVDDFIDHPNLFYENTFDRNKLEIIANKSFELYKDQLLDLMNKAKEFDNHFDNNLSEIIHDKFEKEMNQIPLEELMDEPLETAEWMDLFEKSYDERKEAIDNFNDMDSLINDINDVKNKINSAYFNNYTKDKMNNLLSSMANESQSSDDLTHVIDKSRDLSLKIPIKPIRKRGKELGMRTDEIAKLLGNLFEYFKEMIQNGSPSFERSKQILKKIQINSTQFNDLVKDSLKYKQEGALGALAMQNIMSVAKQIPNTDESKELFERALGAGEGENLLNQWFNSGKSLPPALRKIVKDAAKRVMIDLAKAKSSSLIGSSEAGALPEGSIRPYQMGDDLDTIDIDESLDNILSMGKRVKDVEAGDFIVRKTVTGRRCVIFLIDISGSMSGQPLASASLAAAMLLMAFSRDELGVALFESNTHVLCSINDDIDIDEVVDEILELTARGGTQMQRAIEWAEQQFIKSKSLDRMFVMVTDAMIGDIEISRVHLNAISEMGATSVMILPNIAYGLGNIQNILDETNTQLITVSDWKRFPEIVSEVLSRL